MKNSLRKRIFSGLLSFIIILPAMAQNTFPATGNAGVGTTAPGTLLTIKTVSASFGLEHKNGTVRIKTYVNNGIGQIGTFSNHPFQLMANNGINQLVLLPNGNAGIGTAAPALKLDVSGDALSIASVLEEEAVTGLPIQLLVGVISTQYNRQ